MAWWVTLRVTDIDNKRAHQVTASSPPVTPSSPSRPQGGTCASQAIGASGGVQAVGRPGQAPARLLSSANRAPDHYGVCRHVRI